MINNNDSKTCVAVGSSLGEPTAERRLYHGLAYTINISPNDYIYAIGRWGLASPDDQVRFLRKLHKYGYRSMLKYIDLNMEVENNEVTFEFTKNGEVHSHGYYVLQDKYGGYKRYIALLSKAMKKMLPNSRFAILVKLMTDYEKWREYMVKELDQTGYKPYVARQCETIKRDIDFFIPKKEEIKDKGATAT